MPSKYEEIQYDNPVKSPQFSTKIRIQTIFIRNRYKYEEKNIKFPAVQFSTTKFKNLYMIGLKTKLINFNIFQSQFNHLNLDLNMKTSILHRYLKQKSNVIFE